MQPYHLTSSVNHKHCILNVTGPEEMVLSTQIYLANHIMVSISYSVRASYSASVSFIEIPMECCM